MLATFVCPPPKKKNIHDIYILRIKLAKVSQQESHSFGKLRHVKAPENSLSQRCDCKCLVLFCISPVMNWRLVVWATPSLFSPAGIDFGTPATLSAGELKTSDRKCLMDALLVTPFAHKQLPTPLFHILSFLPHPLPSTLSRTEYH